MEKKKAGNWRSYSIKLESTREDDIAKYTKFIFLQMIDLAALCYSSSVLSKSALAVCLYMFTSIKPNGCLFESLVSLFEAFSCILHALAQNNVHYETPSTISTFQCSYKFPSLRQQRKNDEQPRTIYHSDVNFKHQAPYIRKHNTILLEQWYTLLYNAKHWSGILQLIFRKLFRYKIAQFVFKLYYQANDVFVDFHMSIITFVRNNF